MAAKAKQAKQKFIQVGFTALRDPATGEHLPPVPLYIEATPETTEEEGAMVKDIGRVFADRMKQYIEASKAEATKEKRRRAKSEGSKKT